MSAETHSKCPKCGGGRTHAEGVTSYGKCGSNWGPSWDTGVVKVFNQSPECRIAELENQMRHMVRLDDPVVTGLVDVLIRYHILNPSEEAKKALSAYEARVKPIQEP
jgi:hypothetical protein